MKNIYDDSLGDYIVRVSSPVWVVEEVRPQMDYTLMLKFAGGERKIYDAKPLLEKAIYEPLKNLAFFMGAKVEGDTVVWNDEVDIAPEHLYEYSMPL